MPILDSFVHYSVCCFDLVVIIADGSIGDLPSIRSSQRQPERFFRWKGTEEQNVTIIGRYALALFQEKLVFSLEVGWTVVCSC